MIEIGQIQKIEEQEPNLAQPDRLMDDEQFLEELYAEEFKERVLELLRNDEQIRRVIVRIAMSSPHIVKQY